MANSGIGTTSPGSPEEIHIVANSTCILEGHHQLGRSMDPPIKALAGARRTQARAGLGSRPPFMTTSPSKMNPTRCRNVQAKWTGRLDWLRLRRGGKRKGLQRARDLVVGTKVPSQTVANYIKESGPGTLAISGKTGGGLLKRIPAGNTGPHRQASPPGCAPPQSEAKGNSPRGSTDHRFIMGSRNQLISGRHCGMGCTLNCGPEKLVSAERKKIENKNRNMSSATLRCFGKWGPFPGKYSVPA